MARYIDADALLNAFKENCQTEYQGDSWYGSEPMFFVDDVIECINDAPTADVRENVKGEWVLDEEPHDGDCRCSYCGVCIDQMHERNHPLLNALTNNKWWTFYKFCPKCGADMRGEGRDDI